MTFQQRVILALGLSALIFLAFEWLTPKPDPATETPAIAETGKGEAKADGQPTPEPAEVDDAPPTSDVEVVERELANDLLRLSVSNRGPGRGGVLEGIELLAPQFRGETTATDSLRLAGASNLEISFADEASDLKIPRNATYELRSEGDRFVEFGYRGVGVDVSERFELRDGYEAHLTVKVTNTGKEPVEQRLHVSTRVGVGDSQYDVSRGLCRAADDLETEDKGDVEDGPIHYAGPIRWGGVDNKYFGLYVVPGQPGADCDIRLAETGGYLVDRVSSPVTSLDPGASQSYEFSIFVGAKELERLVAFDKSAGPELDMKDAIDWGVFGGLSEALGRLLLSMLRWFYGLTTSWGISIVLLTIVVKLATLPLTLKQMSSMKHMREIQPEIAKIKAKYADDRVKQGQEMQALFARSGVNPLAGCLPTLVQLPIWFALYSMLSAAVELVHQKFLWLPDLTRQDPYFILPLALGSLMIVQNRMMPSTMDEAQAKMMRWLMPIMFTAFMLFLPSGLAVYIFANIVLSIIQTAAQVGVRGNSTPTPGAVIDTKVVEPKGPGKKKGS